MRVLSYRLELTDDNGYVISNATPNLGSTIATEVQAKSPGIGMIILDLPDVCKGDSGAAKLDGELRREKFLNQFEFVEDCENPEFRECYQRALCGEKTDWKLASVHVSLGYLWLEFASKKRWKELDGENEVSDDAPHYSEGVTFIPHERGGGLFRFEVDRPDGLVETYKVSVQQGYTRIEEQIGNQKRTISFDPRDKKKHQWVTVEQYC